MSREIKFRGLDISGNWYYGLLSHPTDRRVAREIGWYISNKVGCPFAYQVRPETIGQFTGLLDKNGKEIYENDLVVPCHKKRNNIKGMTLAVYWNTNRMHWGLVVPHRQNLRHSSADIANLTSTTKVEIIGNIHTSPELLEAQ